MEFKPIGRIKSDFKKPEETIICCEKGLKADSLSKIIVFDEFKEGLKGIDKCSHIFVLYFLHKIKKQELVTYPGPLSIKDLPSVGVFASRSQYRPNPIALRLVELIEVKDRELIVKGLDGIDGSPVIDIKPYVSGFDRPKNIKEAPWYNWMSNC